MGITLAVLLPTNVTTLLLPLCPGHKAGWLAYVYALFGCRGVYKEGTPMVKLIFDLWRRTCLYYIILRA
jgi:hypothetical protein